MTRRVLIIVVLALGCGRLATEEAADPPLQAPAVADSTPQPAATEARAAEAKPKGLDLGSYPPEVRAFYADCAHSFEVEDDMEGGNVDECLRIDFDQNCAADPSGCWDQGESCKGDCPSECSECSAACATTCDGCKGECPAGDAACRVACAEKRSACRDGCMEAKSKCTEQCESDRKACYDKFEGEVAERCHKCEEMMRCISEVMEEDGPDPWEKCGKRYRKQPDFCKEACLTF